MSEQSSAPGSAGPSSGNSASANSAHANPDRVNQGPVIRPWTQAALIVVLMVVTLYAFHERSVAWRSATRNADLVSALNATRDQVSALNTRVESLSAQQAAEKPAAAHPGVYQKPMTAASSRRRLDDPRWKKMQGQLDDQAKQIESARQDLGDTRTQLQGSIATTHDELVLLEKKGERSYYEFDLDKSGDFTREGSVGVRLRKANNKHEYVDLEMMVDDFKLSKKHVILYEPVLLYSGKSKVPIELVINDISKNHVHGYVSEPKYKNEDLEALAGASANNAAGANGAPVDPTAKPSPAREKLPLPDNKN